LLLPELGYAGTTTNHIAERAGVNIASLYEYFPGKDAIVAQVAERLVERVLGKLAEGASRVMEHGEEGAVRRWIDLIHETVGQEGALSAVFLNQVPYTNQLPSIQAIGPRLLEFSLRIREHAGGFVRADLSPTTLQLVNNLVTSTIMQLVLEPPGDAVARALLDELGDRVESWIREPRRLARN
jgi:AcrR family transcriptional regulator